MLSDDDRHALAAIERRLLADDPALARRWAATVANGPRRVAASDTTQRCNYAGVVALSLMLLTASVALHLPVTAALCAVVALAALVLHAQRHDHHDSGPGAG